MEWTTLMWIPLAVLMIVKSIRVAVVVADTARHLSRTMAKSRPIASEKVQGDGTVNRPTDTR